LGGASSNETKKDKNQINGNSDPYTAAYEKFAEKSKEKIEAMNKAMERFNAEQDMLHRKRQESRR